MSLTCKHVVIVVPTLSADLVCDMQLAQAVNVQYVDGLTPYLQHTLLTVLQGGDTGHSLLLATICRSNVDPVISLRSSEAGRWGGRGLA